jgi:uncharacterized protein YdeI (BOF family)
MKKFSLLFVMLLTLGMVLATTGCHKSTTAQQPSQAVSQPEQSATPQASGMQATPEATAGAQSTTTTAQ